MAQAGIDSVLVENTLRDITISPRLLGQPVGYELEPEPEPE
jgi:hypothetical protein